MDNFKWAIVGTGYIANRFAEGLSEVKDGELSAVISRHEDTGKAFAEKHGAGKIYTDYDEFLEHEKPDAVYIGNPNDCHYSYIMKALERGLNVLSEKPMVDNEIQLREVILKAEEKDVFLMEGMWTRCFPAVKQARKWISEGYIGKPLTLNAAFDIKTVEDDWQPWKGGIAHAAGSLRDVGIYSLAMAYLAFPQDPVNVVSTFKSNGEVDECFRMMLDYGDGKVAMLGGAFNQQGSDMAEIIGEKGRIIIGPEFWHPTTAEMYLNDGGMMAFDQEYPATGFQFEIEAVQTAIRAGRKECSDFTHEESVKIGRLIENERKKWGIIYASDVQ